MEDYSIGIEDEKFICLNCDRKVMEKVDHFLYKCFYKCPECGQEINIIGEYDSEFCGTGEQLERRQQEYLENKNREIEI